MPAAVNANNEFEKVAAMSKFGRVLLMSAAMGAAAMAGVNAASADDPLMGRAPWNFTPQNRAAIAVAIKQVEDGTGGGGASAIVCGGTSGASGEGSTGSGSSATANSSCIIINNSD